MKSFLAFGLSLVYLFFLLVGLFLLFSVAKKWRAVRCACGRFFDSLLHRRDRFIDDPPLFI